MDYTNDDALLDPLADDAVEVTDTDAEGVEDTEDNSIGVYDLTDEGIEEAA